MIQRSNLGRRPRAAAARTLPLLAAVAGLLVAQGAAAPKVGASLRCQDHGAYVVCDNGRTYVLPGTGGGNVIVVPPAQPRDYPPALSARDEADYTAILNRWAREARRSCREQGVERLSDRNLCERQTVEQRTRAAGDDRLLYFYEQEWRLRR